MAFWARLLGRERKGAEIITSEGLRAFLDVYGGRQSRAGVTVDWQMALRVATVFACVRVIAEGVAQVPYKLYRRQGDRRTRLVEHPLLEMLRRPNPLQTGFALRETMLMHAALTGNAYCFVNRVGLAREPREVIPILPGRVDVAVRPDGTLRYRATLAEGREVVELPDDSVWHLRGPSWDGRLGLDATRIARDAIGLSVAIERGQADFHRNGAKTSGLYSVKEKLSPERYEQLRSNFLRQAEQMEAYRPLILDGDAEYTPITMSGVDQQLLETRRHQIEEVCRAYRVLPIMIGHYDKAATYASSEQMFIAHAVHTITPWATRYEQSAEAALTGPDDNLDLVADLRGLMRGAAKDRAEYNARALGSGGAPAWATQNEIREDEGLDPIEGGDELPQQQPARPPAG